MERNSAYMYASVCMRMCICMRISNYTYLPQDESSPHNMKLTDHHMFTPFPP